MKTKSERPATSQSAIKTVHAALTILKNAGGSMLGREVLNKIRETVPLTEWELGRYEKTHYVRWESILQFYSINLMKAGYLLKQKGVWYITPEGEKMLSLKPEELFDKANALYREWAAKNKKSAPEETEIEEIPTTQEETLEQLESQAKDGLKEFILKKDPYEFQKLIAALLHGMGYYTPFVAPRGPDGGVDIVAYKDPLGTETPRIKVQVKHRPNTNVPITDVKNLVGSLNKDGDIGLFVTSGSFTSESDKFARTSHIHIKLIDLNQFIDLWQEYYPKFTDEEKNLLPLHPIYFLGSNE
jgi:restriction system protein